MRFRAIWVDSYGSLSHLAVPMMGELTGGLNVLYGPNEAGKSQLKGFLEQSLFPSARMSRDARPLGRVEFTHRGDYYLLELVKKGAALQRRLYLDGVLVEKDISSLFPSLRTGGNEVFSSLYSFGLDQLLAGTTSGSGVLTEHLFGAIASGKGVSISSVFDRLDDRIKRITGREAKTRSLSKALDELENAEQELAARILDEEAFLGRYQERDRIRERISDLEREQAAVLHQQRMLGEVLRMGNEYNSYLEATEFLEKHPKLAGVSSELLRDIESTFALYRATGAAVEESEAKLASASMRLQLFEIDRSLLDRQEKVLTASNVRNELMALQKDELEQNAELQAARSEIGRMIADLQTREGEVEISTGISSPSYAIETLEKLGGNLDSLERQMSEYSSSSLLHASVGELAAKKAEVETAIRRLSDLAGETHPPSQTEKQRGLIFGSTVVLTGLVIVAYLYSTKVITGLIEVLLSVGILFTAAFVVTLVVSGRESKLRSTSKGEQMLDELGIASFEQRELLIRLEELQAERREIEALAGFRSETERIATILTAFMPNIDRSETLEMLSQKVEGLLHLMRSVSDKEKLERAVARSKAKVEDRKGDLVSLLQADFAEIALPSDPTPDHLDVVIAGLMERLSSMREIWSQAETLDRDTKANKAELKKLSGELETHVRRLDDLLDGSGFDHASLNEDLLSLFRNYDRKRAEKIMFLRSAESVFGVDFEEIRPHFESGRLAVEESVSSLGKTAGELQDERDRLLGTEAEIRAEEKRLETSSSVVEAQALVETLRLEAEEIAERLRASVLARHLLSAASVRFEELHQPELLRISSEIFSRVTQGRYTSVFKKQGPKGDAIFARNESGEDVLDSDLSRGTREQLYISIRLALVERPNALDLPLLMDDVMVNADIERAQGLASELASVAKYRQILYFCAKPDAIRLFETAGADINVVEMTRL